MAFGPCAPQDSCEDSPKYLKLDGMCLFVCLGLNYVNLRLLLRRQQEVFQEQQCFPDTLLHIHISESRRRNVNGDEVSLCTTVKQRHHGERLKRIL